MFTQTSIVRHLSLLVLLVCAACGAAPSGEDQSIVDCPTPVVLDITCFSPDIGCPEGFHLEGIRCEPNPCQPACAGKNCGLDGCGGTCGSCEGPLLCTVDGTCVCIPDCADKACGEDGCGGSCGVCPDGYHCESEGCVADPCEPACDGLDCGPDGCGGTCSQCTGQEVCSADGDCVCVPDCQGKMCGDDGCEGTCGSCPEEYHCTDYVCIAEACVPDCTEKACGDDGCGGSCGMCGGQEVCTEEHQCVCIPDCADKACGDDGCGGTCGMCPVGYHCEPDGCVADPCEPACAGKTCGDDSCGGTCGQCAGQEVCSANGDCVCVPDCQGKMCGDDGCEGTCGSCPEKYHCTDYVCIADACAPDCADNPCGDDGCGGSCGMCGVQDVCTEDHQCVCVPDCADKACGDDSCGGSCGLCPDGYHCEPDGCVADPCEPACAGKTCGDDSCGGTCGQCAGQEVCSANGDCVCVPDCQGKMCGDDGCEGTCGSCPEEYHCTDYVCIADACAPDCADKTCGDDGCGGSCGMCGVQDVCTEDHQCVCIPDCADKACGDDSCGGSCGACPAGYHCEPDGCVADPCDPTCDGLDCGLDGCGGSCGQCPDVGYCSAGYCYDCSQEGLCRATSCPDDGNPCSQEMVAADGSCQAVVNYACVEAVETLQELYRGAQAYYSNWQKVGNTWQPRPITQGETFPLVQGLTPTQGTCCWTQGGPDNNHDNLCDNKGDGSIFEDTVWKFLDFRRSGPHPFVYGFEEIGDGTEGEPLFEARVVADLDCDGQPVTFVATGQFGETPGSHIDATSWHKPFSKLGLPLHVDFIGEGAESPTHQVPSMWPLSDPNEWDLSNVYGIFLQGTIVARYAEAFGNLLRIGHGALGYYGTPKAQAGLPTCQQAAADQNMLTAWSDALPAYQPLMQGLTPVYGSCCPGQGADKDDDQLCDPDPSIWSDFPWLTMHFTLFGSHKAIYTFSELQEGDESTGFRITALQDDHCFYVNNRFVLHGAIDHDDTCAATLGFTAEFMADSYYGDGKPSLGIDLSPGSVFYSYLLEAVGGPGYSLTPLQYEAEHPAAFDTLANIMQAMEDHWGTACSLPSYPEETPDASDCCAEAVDANDDGLCDANPQAWNQLFWNSIGFAINTPHRYRYEVTGEAIDATHTLLTVSAMGNSPTCQGGSGLTFRRVGIADATPGQCVITWFTGYNLGVWYQ